jgi:antirestriction protein ArdC
MQSVSRSARVRKSAAGASTPTNRADVYQIITDRIVELLERGVVPWRKPWRTSGGPRSLASGKAYRGVNVFMLNCAGFESPYWLTFKQAQGRGGSVRKGERSSIVVFWKWLEREERDAETGRLAKRRFPLLRYYRVFNVEQCDGIEYPATRVDESAIPAIERCDAVVDAMPKRPTIEHHGEQALYRPSTDTVVMPRRPRFTSPEAYYTTLYHELTHATGHKSRLNRAGIAEPSRFGSQSYAREELVAEMGAAFLCGHTGIDPATIEQSASYVDSWLGRLRNDRKLVVTAAAQAQKASDFILGRTFGESPGSDGEA